MPATSPGSSTRAIGRFTGVTLDKAAVGTSGEGSLGRLMADPEFADDAKDLGKIMKRHPWRILERPKD